MNDEEIDTGLAGLTVTVTDHKTVPHTCHNATGGNRCDVCFGPIAAGDTLTRPSAVVAPVPGGGAVPARATTPMPEGWTLHRVAALVSDVAQDMYELPYLLNKHELTEKQYKTLEKNPFFQRALEAEIITWSGANSIQKRTMLQAALSVEAAMPTLAARLQSKTEPLGEIVALLKQFSEMAGVTGARAAAGPATFGERFKIVINLGGESMQKEASPSMKVIDQAPAA